MDTAARNFVEPGHGTRATTAATPDSAPTAAPAASVDNPPKSVPGVRPDSYIIGAEDVITVYVWKEPDMSKTIPVRPDGMISLPLIGEVKAAGYTPVQLQDVLADSHEEVRLRTAGDGGRREDWQLELQYRG